MNATELAQKMLEWEKGKRALDTLSAEIEAEVLTIGKTQVVGGCRATYSGGRSTYDYQVPCQDVPGDALAKFSTSRDVTDWVRVAAEVPDIVAKFTVTTFDFDYRAICKEEGLKPLVLSTTAPSVTVKLEG
jgi:hypothetical protein